MPGMLLSSPRARTWSGERAGTAGRPSRAAARGGAGSVRRAGLIVQVCFANDAVPPGRPFESPKRASAPVDRWAARAVSIGNSVAEAQAGSELFSWTRQWYPLVPIDILNEAEPHPMEILGKKVVVWKDGEGEWRVLDDVCPHRLAPLSIGRVEEGHLVCRYHGWRFAGDGACAGIPCSADAGADRAACSNPRSRVDSYPVQVRQGLLWVWPDSSSTRDQDCKTVEPAVHEPFENGGAGPTWATNEMQVGYVQMVENTMDPSHANFLHEGVAPMFKPENSLPMGPMVVQGGRVRPEGFVLKHGGYSTHNHGMEATRTWSAPSSNFVEYRMPTGMTMLFNLYFVPVAPGRTRVIGGFHMQPTAGEPPGSPAPAAKERGAAGVKHKSASGGTGAGKKKKGRVSLSAAFGPPGAKKGPLATVKSLPAVLLGWLAARIFPRTVMVGLAHTAGANTLNGQDAVVMNWAEAVAAAAKGGRGAPNYLPSHADEGIVAMKRWLAMGGGGPWDEEAEWAAARVKDHPEILDQWQVHTKDCRHCQAAMRELQAVAARLARVGTCLLAVSAAMLVVPPVPLRLAAVAAAVGALARVGAGAVRLRAHRFLSPIPPLSAPTFDLWR